MLHNSFALPYTCKHVSRCSLYKYLRLNYTWSKFYLFIHGRSSRPHKKKPSQSWLIETIKRNITRLEKDLPNASCSSFVQIFNFLNWFAANKSILPSTLRYGLDVCMCIFLSLFVTSMQVPLILRNHTCIEWLDTYCSSIRVPIPTTYSFAIAIDLKRCRVVSFLFFSLIFKENQAITAYRPMWDEGGVSKKSGLGYQRQFLAMSDIY